MMGCPPTQACGGLHLRARSKRERAAFDFKFAGCGTPAREGSTTFFMADDAKDLLVAGVDPRVAYAVPEPLSVRSLFVTVRSNFLTSQALEFQLLRNGVPVGSPVNFDGSEAAFAVKSALFNVLFAPGDVFDVRIVASPSMQGSGKFCASATLGVVK